MADSMTITNAFDSLNLLEENQQVVRDDQWPGFNNGDRKYGDEVDANVDIVKGLSDDNERPGFDDGDHKDGGEIDERHGSDDLANRNVVKDLSSDDEKRTEIGDGDEVDERLGSNDDEWSGLGDDHRIVGVEVDERRGFDDLRVYSDYAYEGESKPFINQPNNLPIEEDELYCSSNEFDRYPYDCWSWSSYYIEDSYDRDLEIEENDIYVPYEARKEPGKQRLKRLSGKKTGTTKLMKLKRMPKCCCNCHRLVNG